MLAATAERLRSVVRATDVVGRLGGEEFVLILPGADAEAAEDCAERARAALAELTVRGRPLAASAGVAAAPADGVDAGELLRTATPRCTGPSARAAGGPSATCPGAVVPEAQQRDEIAALLERGHVRAAHACSSRSSSWPRAARPATRRSPASRASRRAGRTSGSRRRIASGSGEELEALALRAALAVPGRPEGTFLAVNVSPRALLSAPVRAALPEDLTGIVVELTEHELFGAEGELETELAALRARGARVALDDAGAGYAGLQQIIRIAPDILKLDRALVHGAHADGSRQALLEALIGFAGTTGAAVCAEGVEDLDDVRTLVALDVTYAQGYGLARPGAAVAGADRGGGDRGRGRDPCRPARLDRPARRRGRVRQRHGRAGRRAGRRDRDRRPRRRDPQRRPHPARRRRRADARRPCREQPRARLRAQRQPAPAHAGRSTTSPPPATCSTTASRARSSWATRRATRPSSPSSTPSAWPRC